MNLSIVTTDMKKSYSFEASDNFVLEDIFNCGQCFRFNKTNFGFAGVAGSRYIELSQNDSLITIKGCDKNDFLEFWHDYFDLDFDYNSCINELSHDKTLKIASQYAKGIRILHQDHWEALCSFIISQNNNIPRIKKIIEALSEKYGEYICTSIDGKKFYSFPTAKAILDAGEQEIFNLKTGFRAKYIIDAAEKIVNGDIDFNKIEEMPTEKALEELCKIKGVGPKVASCVLLFSFRKYDCFPIDVWMKRILNKYYPDFKDKSYFGRYAGIAQQYLFYYERCQSGVFLD